MIISYQLPSLGSQVKYQEADQHLNYEEANKDYSSNFLAPALRDSLVDGRKPQS